MTPEVQKLQIAETDEKSVDMECSDVEIFTNTESIATPAFNAYGTKYIVHISSQQKSASNFTINSNPIEKIEDAFQVNRLLCSCLEGMRSMFAPKTDLEMTLLRNVGNYLRKRLTKIPLELVTSYWYHCVTVVRSRQVTQ